MNGPIVYAWVLSPVFQPLGVGSVKARFKWTGQEWKLSMLSYYDAKGRFQRSAPAANYLGLTRRTLAERCMEIYGAPYSEKWQETLKRDGLPSIQLKAGPTR